MAADPRWSDRYAVYRSELVVVLEHRGELLRVLRAWDVGFEAPTAENKSRYESQDLGLGLIPLFDDEKAAAIAVAELKREAEQDTAIADLVRKAAGNAGVDAYVESLTPGMDRFLWALRTHFAAKYERWTPTLGKNRLVGNVEGGGNISHAETEPSLADSDWRPRPEVRPTEPGPGVRIGVVDTSVFLHPWLAGGLVGPAEDFLGPQPDGGYPALAGHGTFVAGLAMQRAPGCVIEFRKVLSDDGGTATSWDVARKIVELGRTGLDVLNLSLGCFTEDGQPPLVLATAIDRLDPEIVVVAAAGNHGDVPTREAGDAEHPAITIGDRRKPSWPAALDDVVAVGAARDDGIRAAFTPDDVPWIDVLSNGVDVSSTYLDGQVNVTYTPGEPRPKEFKGYAEWSGSSFSAALVSGEIARRTVPGRSSAQQAWRAILDELEDGQPGVRPPFLQLR
ncbi:S8 family peptidase [Geodermatophilus sp. CPCC 205506]|uniref:S8 family peptidase n=1 Tax=Geodermatophilus sp. CPCC 205506 TaxID=2936596 RepID=UPI003EEED967